MGGTGTRWFASRTEAPRRWRWQRRAGAAAGLHQKTTISVSRSQPGGLRRSVHERGHGRLTIGRRHRPERHDGFMAAGSRGADIDAPAQDQFKSSSKVLDGSALSLDAVSTPMFDPNKLRRGYSS